MIELSDVTDTNSTKFSTVDLDSSELRFSNHARITIRIKINLSNSLAKMTITNIKATFIYIEVNIFYSIVKKKY